MKKVQFPVYFTESEHTEFMEMSKKRRTTLNQLIRDALYSAKEDPNFLNPTGEKTDLETLIKALEITGDDRIKADHKFKTDLSVQLIILDEKVSLLMKKAKIPQKTIDEIEKKDTSGEEIFND